MSEKFSTKVNYSTKSNKNIDRSKKK
jgi:hypothetical protein